MGGNPRRGSRCELVFRLGNRVDMWLYFEWCKLVVDTDVTARLGRLYSRRSVGRHEARW